MVFHLCTARVAYRVEGVSICLYSTANEHCVILLHCVSAHAISGGGNRKFRAAYHTYFMNKFLGISQL